MSEEANDTQKTTIESVGKLLAGLGVPSLTIGGAREASPGLSELIDQQLDFALFLSCAALALAGAVFALGLLSQQATANKTVELNGGRLSHDAETRVVSYKSMSENFSRALYLSLAGLVSTTAFDGIFEYSPKSFEEGPSSYLILGLETGPWCDILEAGFSGAFLIGYLLVFVFAARTLSRVVYQMVV